MSNSDTALREFAEKYGAQPEGDGNVIDMTEECLSDLTAIISEGYTANEDINQEVEKRIKDRMPNIHEIIDASIISFANIPLTNTMWKRIGFIRGTKWLCSRLTENKQNK